ncbi:energy-coupling factor transporter transmembrane component T [Vannielia sp.]|uniref:energy-coupling factor transporter transmembrane component T n=1 Tax=Vannielia sp. TaxID=2813045 RepID=UPI0026114C9E|nr:energy-coupling factor transporter transmembrane component T [Vannielia sp.]MDF1871915.1 energy-coupling factor transporter transmembrane component T [Vannielia sp.]
MLALTSPVKTPYHGLRAGLKLGLLALATIVLFALGSLWGQVAGLAVVMALYALPGARFARAGVAALRPVALFAVLIAAFHVVTWTPVEGAVVVLRLVSAVALANLVTMVTPLSEMLGFLHWALAPLRALGVKTRGLELAIPLAIRFIPVLGEKGRALGESWRARSRHRRAGWRIAAPLAGLAMDDADRVAEALRARGGMAGGTGK